MLKIFKSRKDREENINSWVFHNSSDRKPNLLYACMGGCIALLLSFAFMLFMYQSKVGIWGLIFGGIVEIWLLDTLTSRHFKWWTMKKYWPLVIFPLLALTIVVALINIYPDPEGTLHRSDILGFCGDFLAFLGTFCLGYFIYAQDRVNEAERTSGKTKLLYGLIRTANSELFRLFQLAANEAYLNVPGNRERIEPITYDPNWGDYYYEYELFAGVNYDLYQTLESFFEIVVQVNEAVKTGQIEAAAKIYERYRDREAYSLVKYQLREVAFCLWHVCKYHEVWDGGSWIEQKSTINIINKLCRQYYYVIENYIYAWLLKHHVDSTVADEDLRREVTDWLMENSPEIKERFGGPRSKRLLSHVVYDCSLKFWEKSTRVNYEQREYFLKQPSAE